jgi:hypothetical protein
MLKNQNEVKEFLKDRFAVHGVILLKQKGDFITYNYRSRTGKLHIENTVQVILRYTTRKRQLHIINTLIAQIIGPDEMGGPTIK